MTIPISWLEGPCLPPSCVRAAIESDEVFEHHLRGCGRELWADFIFNAPASLGVIVTSFCPGVNKIILPLGDSASCLCLLVAGRMFFTGCLVSCFKMPLSFESLVLERVLSPKGACKAALLNGCNFWGQGAQTCYWSPSFISFVISPS